MSSAVQQQSEKKVEVETCCGGADGAGRMIRCGSSVYRSSKAVLRESLDIANANPLSVTQNPFGVVESAKPSAQDVTAAGAAGASAVPPPGSTGFMTTSIFDLFKVGPGPSSSHTIGPMKAAFDFLTMLRAAHASGALTHSKTYKLVVHLHGSLSLTGKGHGTDRAVLAGLLGWLPATCDPNALMKLTDSNDTRFHVPVTVPEKRGDSTPSDASSVGELSSNDTPTTAAHSPPAKRADAESKLGAMINSPVSPNLLQTGFEAANTEYRSIDQLTVGPSDILFHPIEEAEHLRHPNTLIFELSSLSITGNEVLELTEEYYSVGGGFVQKKSELEELEKNGGQQQTDRSVPYPYTSFEQLKIHLRNNPGLTVDELIVQNEMALTGASREEIYKGVDDFVAVMEAAVLRGLHTTGVLPGNLKLQRKANGVFKRARGQTNYLLYLNAYALAASEENAAGQMVVTAPTSGSAGVFPGVIYFMKQQLCLDRDAIRAGVIASCAIGFLVKHNSSISGAEMGCMGEIGTASSMGAAMLARAANLSIAEFEAAAEIAMEHHLGLTCDPVDGYVMVPCIERNPMGAVKAYNAYLLAEQALNQVVSFDRVVVAMRETGEDMNAKYRETGMGGLATAYYADC